MGLDSEQSKQTPEPSIGFVRVHKLNSENLEHLVGALTSPKTNAQWAGAGSELKDLHGSPNQDQVAEVFMGKSEEAYGYDLIVMPQAHMTERMSRTPENRRNLEEAHKRTLKVLVERVKFGLGNTDEAKNLPLDGLVMAEYDVTRDFKRGTKPVGSHLIIFPSAHSTDGWVRFVPFHDLSQRVERFYSKGMLIQLHSLKVEKEKTLESAKAAEAAEPNSIGL
jgi:hypothetical protein